MSSLLSGGSSEITNLLFKKNAFFLLKNPDRNLYPLISNMMNL